MKSQPSLDAHRNSNCRRARREGFFSVLRRFEGSIPRRLDLISERRKLIVSRVGHK